MTTSTSPNPLIGGLDKALADPTPLYAVVGAGDFAVAKIREARGKLDAQAAMTDALSTTLHTYSALATRGRELVTRVRKQPSTQQLDKQLHSTVSRTKAATTTAKKSARTTSSSAQTTSRTARKAAESTKSSAKAATTTAHKTAAAAKQATEDTAKKVGD